MISFESSVDMLRKSVFSEGFFVANMAQNSCRIVSKMKHLLSKIDEKEIKATYGFVRSISSNDVPNEIVNYCVIYAFLKLNEWLKGGGPFKLRSKYLAVADEIATTTSSIYGNNVISKGKHDWKVKITHSGATYGLTFDYIGIADSMHCLDSHFYGSRGIAARDGAKNYAYLSFKSIMSHEMSASRIWKPCQFQSGDTVTVHLNLDDKTVGFSHNDTFLGIAFENIEDGHYRLAMSIIPVVKTQYEIIND